MGTASIVWFRLDLRVEDNPALHYACEQQGPVLPVFIWAPEEEGEWAPGAASKWWLHRSLLSLHGDLKKIGLSLVLKKGASLSTLKQLIKETGATRVYWNRRYEPALIARDTVVKDALRAQNVEVESFNASLLFEPWTIKTKSSSPYQVYTPFWRACSAATPPPAPLPIPRPRSAYRKPLASCEIDEFELEPKNDWAAGIKTTWVPGTTAAKKQLARFIKLAGVEYDSERDRPDRPGTSRLSPHLHFGEISPREVWHKIKPLVDAKGAAKKLGKGGETYLKELVWREFAHHLLFHFPKTPTHPLRPQFAAFPWKRNIKNVRAWQKGLTGYPIVDAGMRELWETGWMHNRVRMIVASFLVKHLLIRWQDGAAWFWDTLVDADLAANTMGWQWSTGCGADAAPYFRIFNPMVQGEKFDPEGIYVRRFVPELAVLDNKWIHRPFDAPDQVLSQCGIKLGKTYPRPIVDHSEARALALEAYDEIKG